MSACLLAYASLFDDSDPLTVHHNIHSGQLRPDLHEEPDMSAVDITRTYELQITTLLALALDLKPLFDLLELSPNPRTGFVSFAMY
jgi:hypothetical protein